MLAPKTVAMYTGNKLWTSSEDVSMNKLPKPSAQMPIGKERSDRRDAGEARSDTGTVLFFCIGNLILRK